MDTEWTGERLEHAIETGATRTVRLRTPLPVIDLVLDRQRRCAGQSAFLPDLYGRDAQLLAALDAPPAAKLL